jgi:uncharacterized protein YecT (DUF1311 family)
MKFSKVILLLVILSHNVNSNTCLDGAETTQDMSDCYSRELKIEGQKLDVILSKAYNESSWIIKEIKESQMAWIQYREAHCKAIYSSYENGTMRFIAHPACMVELTKTRQEEIYTNFIKSF